MNRDVKAKIIKLFRESMSVDYLRETFVNEDIEEIINCLMEKHLLINRPKMQCMAGIQTYIVSDDDIVPRVQQALNEGNTKGAICKQFHIGHTRLNKLIEKYGLTVKNQEPDDIDEVEEHKEISTVAEKEKTDKKPIAKIEKKEKIVSIEPIEKAVTQPTVIVEKKEENFSEETQAKELKDEIKYTDEELKNLIDKGLKEGKTRTQLTRELHVSLKRINRVLAGKPVKNAKKTITTSLIAQIQDYMRYGTTNESIAKNMSMSVNSIKEIKKLLRLTQVPTGKIAVEGAIPTIEEKVVYANKVYGVGRWKFLTKSEVKRLLKESQIEGFRDDLYDF